MAKIRKLPKEYRVYLRACIDAGATAKNTKDGVLVRFLDGGTVMFHSSPGNAARGKAKRAELRTHGVDI